MTDPGKELRVPDFAWLSGMYRTLANLTEECTTLVLQRKDQEDTLIKLRIQLGIINKMHRAVGQVLKRHRAQVKA